MTFPETLYLDAAGGIVRTGDPSAAFLLGTAGQEVPYKVRKKVEAFYSFPPDVIVPPAAKAVPADPPITIRHNDPEVSTRDPEYAPRRRGRPPKIH